VSYAMARRPASLAVLIVLAATAGVIRLEQDKQPERYYAAGMVAMQAERWDAAVFYFQALLDRDPGCAAVEDQLARALDSSMVYVPEGEFPMGSDLGDPDEHPQRVVYLDSLEIDRYEVTNVQYRRFLLASGGDGPRRWPGRYLHLWFERAPDWSGDRYPPGEARHPVVGVRLEEAAEYCAWVNKRLPTEAEWEKAARGTDGRVYPWGNAWNAGRANTGDEGAHYTRPVGSYPSGASPYGALDMAGNVWEWVSDLYDRQYYTWAPQRNPHGPSSGTGEKILRGGAWDSSPDQARASYRNATHFFGPNFRVGFRCARSAGR
jgi:formylglycine-generating enzyme required for sulfatase activity